MARTYDSFYWVWAAMKRRCMNPNVQNYPRYGGRGIKVCEAWMNFDGFNRDMRESYLEAVDGMEPGKRMICLDRVDNDGDYTKENCRWVTYKTNNNNRRNRHEFSHNGKSQTLLEWAKDLGVPRSRLAQRIYGLKWPVERALGEK